MYKYVALSFLFVTTQMNAQSLDQYRWKNRLVVLIASSIDDPLLEKQLEIFRLDPAGLAERKLKVIQLSGGQIRYGFDEQSTWKKSENDLYQDLKSTDENFEAILLGLDGGEKLRDQKALTLDRLFAIIDAMPMRRSELRRQ